MRSKLSPPARRFAGPGRPPLQHTYCNNLIQSPPMRVGVARASLLRPPNSTGILAQEMFRGESLLFMRKEAELRQRPEPLAEGDAPALEPQPAEGPYPGGIGYKAGLGLRLVPEGFQGAEGAGDEHAARRGERLAPTKFPGRTVVGR